jgi:hypothetical protein
MNIGANRDEASRSRGRRFVLLPVAGIVVIGLAASGCGGEARVAGKAGTEAARSYKAPATGIAAGGGSIGGGCASSSAC